MVFFFFFCSQIIDRMTNKLVRNVLGNDVPSVADLAKETSLLFVNQHYSLNGVRPQTPGLVELGGIHITEEKPIREVCWT